MVLLEGDQESLKNLKRRLQFGLTENPNSGGRGASASGCTTNTSTASTHAPLLCPVLRGPFFITHTHILDENTPLPRWKYSQPGSTTLRAQGGGQRG